MSLAPEDRRWEVLARELPFQELAGLRAQADGWRTGIAVAATILTSVAIVKGRSDVAQLAPVWREITVGTVIAAFAALMGALLLSVRVAQGRPGDEIWSTGEALQDWTRTEVSRGSRLLRWAAYLSATGLFLLVVSMATGWLAPSAPSHASPHVLVRTNDGTVCGQLVSVKNGIVTLQTGPAESGRIWTVPLTASLDLTPTAGC